jgi:tRNA 2-thiouridine synthesizing protein A
MTLDYSGLKCPQPVLKLTIEARRTAPGTQVEVLADCPQFPTDVRAWCQKYGKVLLSCTDTGNGKFKALVQL